MKTSIARYLQHSNTDAPDYIEIKDSASVVKYGRQFLSQPSEKSTMKVRYFDDIEQDIFLERQAMRKDSVKTLTGISTRFQYLCEVCFI